MINTPSASEQAILKNAAVDAAVRNEDGSTIRCPSCATVAPPARKFCAECGKALWEPCHGCGALCAAAERFCGACGANLTGGIEERVRQFQRELEEAARLAAEGHFDKAIALLGPMAKADHSRLEESADRARATIEQLAAEREQRREEATNALIQAQEAAAAGDHPGVIRLLDPIPPALRNETAENLLEASRAAWAEITRLNEELRQAVAAQDLDGLLVKMERLVVLQPSDPRLAQRAAQLAVQLCQQAERRLAKFQYDEARKLLERMPERLRTPELSKLLAKATELAWLNWDLQAAPVLSEPLVAAAERMQRLVPGDARVAKLHGELTRRAGLAAANGRGAPMPWARAPETTAVGCPVDWVTAFRTIEIGDEVDKSLLDEHPGCFFTAAGLALQGAGAARLKLNLLPTDAGGMLGRVTRMIRALPARTAWGIDVSSSGLKAVKLTIASDKRQERVTLEGCEWIEHKKALSQALNENDERNLVEETLKKFKERHALRSGERVAVGLPGHLVLTRTLKFPPMADAQLARAVEYEAKHQLPNSLAQLAWAWQALDDADDAATVEHNLILAAVRREFVEKRLGWFRSAGIEADVVQADSLALYNWLAHEHLAASPAGDGSAPGECLALVDVGSDVTNVVVGTRRSIWLRRLQFGAERFTKALVRQLQTTMGQAEELKRNPRRSERLGEIYQALEPLFDELLQEIRGSLDTAAKAQKGAPVARLLAAGGGFQVHGLFRYLRTGR